MEISEWRRKTVPKELCSRLPFKRMGLKKEFREANNN